MPVIFGMNGGGGSDIAVTRSNIVIQEGILGIDAVELNPNIAGTMAYHIDVFYPQLIVTASPDLDVSQTIITATSGAIVYTGFFVDGVCKISIKKLGTYIVTTNEYVLSAAEMTFFAPMERINVNIAMEDLIIYNRGTIGTPGIKIISFNYTSGYKYNADHIYVYNQQMENTYATNYANDIAFTTPYKIDLSKWRKLSMTISCQCQNSNVRPVKLGVANTTTLVSNDIVLIKSKEVIPSNTKVMQIVELDIQDVVGLYYPVVSIYNFGGDKKFIYEIVLS